MTSKHPAQGAMSAQDAIAATMTEDELLFNVKDAATKFGWLFYHTRDSRRSDEGFPDVVLVRGPSSFVIAELKREAGRVSPSQEQWLNALKLVERHVTGVLRYQLDQLFPEDSLRRIDPQWVAPQFQVYVWRPSDWLSGAIEAVLRDG